MSSAHPLRERPQSNSPDPEPARPTTPLRINKHSSPQPRQGLSPRRPSTQIQVQVARRSSNSFKHVRQNNLVTKSPFRTLIPPLLATASSSRRVSGEKRPRPDSMHAQAENEKPLGFKRRQSKSFQGLLQKEPVTKSPFRRRSSDAPSPPPPPLPPKSKLKPAFTPSAMPTSIPSPVRSALSNNRRIHGPRSLGERQGHKATKSVTFDEKCDVLEFDVTDDELEDVSYDENGYGYGYTIGPGGDEDADMDESYDSVDPVADDSITGMVDSLLQATLPHTPPKREDEEDAQLLPPSPSPAEPTHSPPADVDEDSPSTPPRTPTEEDVEPLIRDEEPPFDESFRSARSADDSFRSSRSIDDALDPSNLSIGNSEVSITNLDSHSLLAETDVEGDLPPDASFDPVAGSSPRSRPQSRSGTPLERSFERERSLDRSLEARSTPALTPSRFNSPRSGSASPLHKQLFRPSSTSSLGSLANGSPRTPITRERIQERLLRRKSEDALASRSPSASPLPPRAPATPPAADEDQHDVEDVANTSHITEPATEEPTPFLPAMTRHNPTHDGVMSIDPEVQPIDPPRPSITERAHSVDVIDAKRIFAGLELDFEHGFGLGEEGMSMSAGLMGMSSRTKHSSLPFGEVSALDKLMEDMAQGAGVDVNTSVVSEGQSIGSIKIEAFTEGVKADTFSIADVVRRDMQRGIELRPPDDGEVPVLASDTVVAVRSSPPRPPSSKEAIRAREELIKAKRREARQQEETSSDSDAGSPEPAIVTVTPPAPAPAPASARPMRRRSMSTSEAEKMLARPAAAHRRALSSRDDLLDITALREEDAPLADTINRELMKRENQQRTKYHIREHTETIYATANATTMLGHQHAHGTRAWRAIRRPSDMNEHADQLRQLREQQKSGKAHGKVFVRVVGLKALNVPVPNEPTKVTCTLNNGIHFVTTPEVSLGRDCTIDQEFELIEHSKLEFTLTIKVRRDPHIVAQVKANTPPAPKTRPPPLPILPPPSKGGSSKSGGMRSFLFGSPKKAKTLQLTYQPAPEPPAPNFKPQENLARYLKPDGSLGRAFISFKDIASHCDTRLMETSFPLIGQKIEVGSTAKALQIGEIVLQIFRLPPLPGIPPEQLPQSLEECHRGLTHTRWHKACYMQGTLTQIGGDCTTWRRRHLRIVGSSLVAYNDVTRRAIASIDLRRATNIVDTEDGRDVRSPASAATGRSTYDDDNDPYGVGGVDRSFRLEFGDEQIVFYADSDQEKSDWVSILKALVGRIPPNPLWAEVLFQRQEQSKQSLQTSAPSPPAK